MNKKFGIALLLVATLFSGILLGVYVQAQSGSGTFTISQGMYPGAPSYTIFREGSTYYAKNDYGVIDYYGTNCSEVIDNVINSGLPEQIIQLPMAGQPTISAPCGSIYFPTGEYIISKRIQIPLGSRIKIEGDGYTMQPIDNGQNGGTQIRSTDSDGVLVALNSGTLANGSAISTASGSSIIIRDIEFFQTVEQTTSSSEAISLHGMSQGMLQCVQITSYQPWGSQYQGYGLSIFNYGVGDLIQFISVQVYGFSIGMSLTADHLVLKGVGIGASDTALQLKPMPYVSIDELHIFQTNVTIQVAAGRADWAYMSNLTQLITNLYLEQVGTTDNSYVWIGNHGMRIVMDKVQVSYVRPTIWRPFGFENLSLWEFHNVNVKHAGADSDFTTPPFPSATTPSITNNTNIINPNQCQVFVSVGGGTVTSISINGISTGLTTGSFLLRAEDYINVVYSVEPTTWIWRNFDVSESWP